jgi:hypothetical protein
MKKKHFIFIIQNNNKKRKHIKINNKKDKSFFRKLKHEPNIVEITHLCIRHGVQTSFEINWEVKADAIPGSCEVHHPPVQALPCRVVHTHWDIPLPAPLMRLKLLIQPGSPKHISVIMQVKA